MHDVLAGPRVRVRHQHGVARRLAVVQPALQYEADQQILVEIDRVIVCLRNIGHGPGPRNASRRTAAKAASTRGCAVLYGIVTCLA
jgi:hypothetical protein